jgi:TM2 domain-containing membrane protein YozV
MYKFIGADGQQYGPVNIEQLRKWIAENRLRGETLVQMEGSAEWKPLNAFPELAAELKSAAPPVSSVPPTIGPAPSAAANARASNKIAAGVCGILLGSLGVHKFILGYNGAGLVMLLITLLSVPAGFFTCGVTFLAPSVMHIIGLFEGIIYLTKSDDEFVRTYVDGRKEWF